MVSDLRRIKKSGESDGAGTNDNGTQNETQLVGAEVTINVFCTD